MIGVINKLYGKTWNLDGVTYENGVFTFPANGFAMATCSMPNPVPGHVYYGGVEQKAPSGASFDDRRFEWWVGDEAGNVMAFAYMDGTNDQWVRQSAVLKVDAVVKDGWVMRNFTVNGTAEAYRRNPIIIDLTETFGAGNEPSAAWVDANMIPSPSGDTIFFDVPSMLNEISDKRRMMLAGGKQWAKVPLIIYKSNNSKLTNGTIYNGRDVSVGGLNYGGTRLEGLVMLSTSSNGNFAIDGIDATLYRTLTITYKCGTADGYVLSSWAGKIGWGYSRSGASPALVQSKSPASYASSGTATFDITNVNGNIIIGGRSGSSSYAEYIAIQNITLS